MNNGNSVILGLFSETSIHAGAGRSVGVVDLPVAREVATDYPFVPGSSVKGSLRDRFAGAPGYERIFGQQDNAGTVLVSDARLLLLPVRSLTGVYKWVTCPLLLERYQRDAARSGLTKQFTVPELNNAFEALGAEPGENVYLEELSFTIAAPVPEEIIDAIATLIPFASAQERLTKQVIVVSNDDFNWFARHALDIRARNQLDENKISRNLWYEETLPADSLMYTLLTARTSAGSSEDLDVILEGFTERPYLQLGGNETVGQGWFAVAINRGE